MAVFFAAHSFIFPDFLVYIVTTLDRGHRHSLVYSRYSHVRSSWIRQLGSRSEPDLRMAGASLSWSGIVDRRRHHRAGDTLLQLHCKMIETMLCQLPVRRHFKVLLKEHQDSGRSFMAATP
jgi:hypothetical protein